MRVGVGRFAGCVTDVYNVYKVTLQVQIIAITTIIIIILIMHRVRLGREESVFYVFIFFLLKCRSETVVQGLHG